MNLLKTLACLAFVAFALRGTQAAAEPSAKVPPTRLDPAGLERLEARTNLVYARYGDRELALDLYRPRVRKGDLPAIVCIHGGGWFQGNRAGMRNLAQALALRGYVTVTISYRLSGEAKFPAAIQDAKASVRWLRAHSREWGVDPEKIGVTGLSAGGHLAALLATSGGVPELEGAGGNVASSSAVQACVAMGAQSDLETDRIRQLSLAPANPHYRPFLGGSMEDIPETYALASPRQHLGPKDPPLLFMSGELDDPSTHADAMRADMERLGIPTGLVLIPDAPHAFLGRQPYFEAGLEACEAFFRKHLRENDTPGVSP